MLITILGNPSMPNPQKPFTPVSPGRSFKIGGVKKKKKGGKGLAKEQPPESG